MSKDESNSDTAEIRATDIRVAAMNLLARREQSRAELVTKLFRRFPDMQKVEHELDRLQQDGLQSDQRFVQSFINGRIGRLQGPFKIRQDLNRFDLDESLITQAFDALSINWREQALEAAQRKFRGKNLEQSKERDRARQFLFRRGFDSETCVWAIEQLKTSSDIEQD